MADYEFLQDDGSILFLRIDAMPWQVIGWWEEYKESDEYGFLEFLLSKGVNAEPIEFFSVGWD